MKKYVFFFLFILVILGIAYFYVAFYGLPWKKETVADELKHYVEEKYDIQVEIIDKYYNFKDGSYGAEFVVKDSEKIQFSAYQYHTGMLSDEYPEAVWVQEVTKDVVPVLKESFPSLTVKDYQVNPVYGMGDKLVKGKDIPSYKEVHTEIMFAVNFADWTKEKEEILIKESYDFISKLQEKGARNLGVSFSLEKKGVEEIDYFSIIIEGNQFNQIQSKEDIKQYIYDF